MSLADLNRIVTDHRADLVARLDAGDRAEVASIQARMRAADDPKPHARRLLLALAEALPPDHPVALAILRGANWRAPDVLDRAAIDAEAAAILSLAGLSFEPEDADTTDAGIPVPAPAALMDLVRRRVLAVTPVLSDDEARALRRNPMARDLIRLDRPGEATAFPRFQFEPSGRPREVVVRVNRLLGADRDPWGVTAWWLASNVWLGKPPAALLGADRDDELVACAGAALGED
ncbi:hypothetical protein [Streptomyces sp. 35G-GA-8]|uniref:hypothetical protein n=1 Tax=Streptomyces sp. 35G-GA-8 TaxID=2939434 RepID=UPI00201FAF9D|nr:hypothetical protein [Streptomyces sp. 35G-GA-8]MCL7376970.1 hypothetical protein [Streptomyces sp. 35G-GA-8]